MAGLASTTSRHVFVVSHRVCSPSHACGVKARIKCYHGIEGNKHRSLLQRCPDTDIGFWCVLGFLEYALTEAPTAQLTLLPERICKLTVGLYCGHQGKMWETCCSFMDKLLLRKVSSPPVIVCCAVPAEGMEEALSSLPWAFEFLSTDDEKKSRSLLTASRGDEVYVRLSEHSCDEIGECLSTPSFPQEDVTDHPSYIQSFAVLLKCSNSYQPYLQQLSVTTTTILTLLIFLLWATENVIFLREGAAIAWAVAYNPSDSIELGEAQTVF